MAHCINTNSPEYKNLKTALGNSFPEAVLKATIAVWQEKNGLENWPTVENLSYLLSKPGQSINEKEYNNQVNYRLKAAEKILDNFTKIKQWESNKSIDKNTLWKKISELGIPKQQLELLKESDGNTIEEKLTSFLANYSYTVEINTTKGWNFTNSFATDYYLNTFEEEESYWIASEDNDMFINMVTRYEVVSPDGDSIGTFESKEDAEKEIDRLNANKPNSQYYETLSVPGGTNYTENEISTPLIIPSIKGHAQFSTDNGIGWFRSDEKAIGDKDIDLGEDPAWSGRRILEGKNKQGSKTRRILELQSDLFQKGRDRDDLIKRNNDNYIFRNGKPIGYEKNQFLQLLNKDNNWVTFFIKSIIQDSAKKGYEKVLFPKGETAAKIEGHQTIADEINTKNEVITQLKVNRDVQQQVLDNIDNDTENFISGKNKYFASINTVYTGIGNEAKLTITSDGKEKYNISTIKDKNWKLGSKEEFALIVKNHIKKEYSTKVKDLNNRIEQLEKEIQELKSQGVEKLKPIEAFYEIQVGNILEKQYGKDNVKTITDEYGNKWREITINQARDLSNILLQLPPSRKIEEFVASEKTIRDLAARMSDRIGIPVKYISDRSQQFKGKLEENTAIVNLAYATLDTPIHEILGHPIIRAIKNIEDSKARYFLDNEGVYKNGNKWYHLSNNKGGGIVLNSMEEVDKFLAKENTTTLYQNLLKELEYGKGKEVFNRIKRDYVYKNSYRIIKDTWGTDGYEVVKNESEVQLGGTFFKTIEEAQEFVNKNNIPYTLEEHQEEAIVELLGLYTADRLDKVKDGKLISLLKRLLKEMKAFMKQLLGQKEVEIDKLPDNMTLGNIADLLAYSNSKLILPGNEVIYTTPDNQQFKTYAEASNHISQLAKSVEDVDLSNISLEHKLSKEDLQKIKELENQKKEKEDYFGSKKYQQDKDTELSKLNKKLEELGNKKVEFYSQEPYLDLEDKKKYGFQDFNHVRVESTYSRGNEYHKDILGENYEGYYIHGYNIATGKPEKKILPITKEQAINIWKKDESAKYEIEDQQEIFETEFSIKSLQEDGRIKYEINSIKKEIKNIKEGQNTIQNFIEKNKEYEQSKEIIEEWKKVNNIQYNPEEVYSRGQELVSVVGAYSDFDVNLMMQNLLQHIEDNQKAGGEFTISAFTKPVDKQISHLEGGGGKIKFKIYPQSQDIKWAANTDVYSGSVWDASEKVNKDKKSELLGVSYTKYPSLRNINEIQPNLANIIDNLTHHHNELGIALTGSNFRLEYDENIPYSTKKIINSINSILDSKYGKLVKPEISKKPYEVEATSQEEVDIYLKQGYKKTIFDHEYDVQKMIRKGLQPTQTNKTLKESIESVRSKVFSTTNRPKSLAELQEGDSFIYFEKDGKYFKEDLSEQVDIEISKEEYEGKKEYTSQALINTKIAKLKEVAQKYPRSLIRSEVRPINSSFNLGFTVDELPFQRVSNSSFQQSQQSLNKPNGEISYSLDNASGVNYEDVNFPDLDVDAILAASGIETGADPEKTQRFLVVKKTLYHNIKQLNNRIFHLKDRIRNSKSTSIKETLNVQLINLEDQLEKYQQQQDAFKDVQQVEQLRSYAEQDIARVNELLAQPTLSSEDLEEARRLVHLWSSIGDFSPNMAESHPLFTADELQMDSLKYGFQDAEGNHIKGFADFKAEMDKLGGIVEGKAAEIVIDFVRNQLRDKTITKEDIFKAMPDISAPKLYTTSLDWVNDSIAQSIAATIRKIEAEALRDSQERLDKLDSLYNKVKAKYGKNVDILKQKLRDGSLTGNLVYRFTPEYFDTRHLLLSEARFENTAEKWKAYFDWNRSENIYFDVRILFDENGYEKFTPEAEAHKEELVKHLGEKGFQYYYEKQREKLNSYFEAKEAFKLSLESKPEYSQGEREGLLTVWEASHSPYIELDRIIDQKIIKVDGKSVGRGRVNYTIGVPRKFRDNGVLTGYYDANYNAVEADPTLYEYYQELIKTLGEIRAFLPEEDRRQLQVNSLPYIKNKLLGMYANDGLKVGASGIMQLVQTLYTEGIQSEVEFGEADLSTNAINRGAVMEFKDKTAKMIASQLQVKISEYVNKNGTSPDRSQILKWRNEIRNQLAQEKSWDINSVMKVYTTAAMAYKHKSAVSSAVNLAQIALLQKKAIKPKGTRGSIDIYGEPLTQQGLKNLSEMLTYTTDVFYGMPRHAVEGKIKEVVVKGYEKEFERLRVALETNQSNFDKGYISEAKYKRNKELFEREMKSLQTNISVSAIGDGFLKYGQLVGMGYNLIAGVVNLMVGSMENATQSADAGLITPKALSLAYKDVIHILGNKTTPLGRKVINLDRKLNITQKAQNELYNNTSEFWKRFRALSPFKITEKTEMMNQLPLAFALMRSKTAFNNKGEEISMWDAFDADGNVKEGYTLSKEMSNEQAISEYQLQVTQLINHTHGNYNLNSPIYAKKFIVGRAAFQYRTWMPEMFLRRWGAEREDKLLGIKTKGRWRSYAQVVKASKDRENPDIAYTKLENTLYATKQLIRKVLFIPQYKYALDAQGNRVSYKEAYDKDGRLKTGYKPIRAFDTRMTELDARNMRANLVEISLLIQLYLTKLLLLAVMPDLDDEKKRVVIALLNLGSRLKTDILMFANPVEYDKLNKSLLPVSQYIKHIATWGADASNFLMTWDDDSWEEFVKQTGIITPGFSQARRVYTYTDKQFTK